MLSPQFSDSASPSVTELWAEHATRIMTSRVLNNWSNRPNTACKYEIYCSYFVCHMIYRCNLRFSLLVEGLFRYNAHFTIMLFCLAPMSVITRLQCSSNLILLLLISIYIDCQLCELLWSNMALKRCMSTEHLWNRKLVSLTSAVSSQIFLPRSQSSWRADMLSTPNVSIAIGSKI